jgi:hypothetical protein
VALVEIDAPPDVAADHPAVYRPWLLHAFFEQVCAYCGLPGQVVHLDHVEPQAYAPDRYLDPTNLLPACAECNGPSGKWDYHPQQRARRRLRQDRTGFTVLDPRRDDYARLYEIDAMGHIDARPGVDHERALWNAAVLLRLDRRRAREHRRELQDLRDAAEHLLVEGPIERLDRLVDVMARRFLFFELYDLPMSPNLGRLARARRDTLRTSG